MKKTLAKIAHDHSTHFQKDPQETDRNHQIEYSTLERRKIQATSQRQQSMDQLGIRENQGNLKEK